jgi:acetyl-CoA synthetase
LTSPAQSTEEGDVAVEEERDLEVLVEEEERFPPPASFTEQANVADPSVYDEAERDFEAWWEKWAKELDWFEPWQTVLEWNPPWAKWFKEGKLNVSHNCLDRHVVAGRGDKVAYHWIGEDGATREVTYAELLEMTKRFANVLKSLGVGPEDVVGIYMPMIPETPAAMLACARIGATHNVVFGGFSVEAVKERMEVSDAKVLVTCNTSLRRGKPMPMKTNVDEVLGDLPKLEHVIVVARTDDDCPMQEGRDIWWHEACEQAGAECEAEPLEAEHPLYILYTSGSTAKPKGILHTTGGYLTGCYATTKLIFDVKPDEDVYWCAADIGWVTGHSYIVYGPLANGLTSVMYEGAPDYPDKDRWWQIVEKHKVTIMYTAPTAIRACIKWGREYPERHDLSSLRLLGSVGEPINPKAWIWYHKIIGGERCPIVDTWWQTETGHIMITPLPGITETKPGSATKPFPGIEAGVVDRDGHLVEEGGGFLTLRRPWPGMLRTLYKEDERYVETYWSKWGKDVYVVGDAAKIDADGYFWIVGRTDDVVNVSGHRMSTMEIESAIVSHDRVAEAAVIGQADEDSGQAIVAFVTLEGGAREGETSDSLDDELREHVAKKIGKLARPKRFVYADDLPKTRSGKIMRRLLRDIAEGRELGDVSTLRDPKVTEMIQGAMSSGDSEE